MCPSYMATLEEEHSTRGRAHMLFEMLQGEVIADAWNNEHVKESLDLCLSCKACKSECPTNVDIATYRSEFLSHYYETHARPLDAYAFGMIDRWARLGSMRPAARQLHEQRARRERADAPRAAPGARARDAASRHRELQAPGRETAGTHGRESARRRRSAERDVILWVDTFNNYFHPADERGGARGAAGGRLPRERAARSPVLRPPAVRLRPAHAGEAVPAARDDGARAADRRRLPDGRARAELRVGLPRRAAESLPRRSARRPAAPPDVPAERVPDEAGARLRAAHGWRARSCSTATAIRRRS